MYKHIFGSLESARILVTGASGFLGSRLCKYLSNHTSELFGVSREKQVQEGYISWFQLNLYDQAALRNLIINIKPEIIFHVSGLSNGSRKIELVKPTLNSNLICTINLLLSTYGTSCKRIILANSLEESTYHSQDLIPNSPYTASKIAEGLYSRMFHALYQSPVVISRIAYIYGPGIEKISRIIPYTLHSIFNKHYPVYSSGTRKMDWVYIDDVIEGLFTLATVPGILGQTFDIGTGHLTSIKEVVEELFKLLDTDIQPEFGALPDRPLENEFAANAEDTLARIGWKAQTKLKDGLITTKEWYWDYLSVHNQG